MKSDVKKQWVRALRSGKYTKGTKKLKSGDRYCCLGVLTELYFKSPANKKKETWSPGGTFRGNNELLSSPVMKWAGLSSDNPGVNTRYGDHSLSEINDGETSLGNVRFTTIADLIEENL